MEKKDITWGIVRSRREPKQSRRMKQKSLDFGNGAADEEQYMRTYGWLKHQGGWILIRKRSDIQAIGWDPHKMCKQSKEHCVVELYMTWRENTKYKTGRVSNLISHLGVVGTWWYISYYIRLVQYNTFRYTPSKRGSKKNTSCMTGTWLLITGACCTSEKQNLKNTYLCMHGWTKVYIYIQELEYVLTYFNIASCYMVLYIFY